MQKSAFIFVLILIAPFLVTSCTHQEEIKPTLSYTPPTHLVEKLPSPFFPLSAEEKEMAWGKELLIASSLAKEQDLFRSVTAYKRARILLQDSSSAESDSKRQIQIEYGLLLSYWLAHKYEQVIESFEKSKLKVNSSDFAAYDALLLILYDSYVRNGDTKKAEAIFQFMKSKSQPQADKITLSYAIANANLAQLKKSSAPEITSLLNTYEQHKKSQTRAELLNALLPGAGYYYVGQTQSAATSFLLNALFIAASYQFFQHGQTAAGIITAGFELGWYVGGIRGAGLAAKQYNNTLYSHLAQDTMSKEKLFPILMLDYGF